VRHGDILSLEYKSIERWPLARWPIDRARGAQMRTFRRAKYRKSPLHEIEQFAG